MERGRGSGQAIILLLALALWSLGEHASLWAPVAAYGVAWLVVNVVEVVRPNVLRAPVSRAQALGVVLLVAVPSAAQAFRLFDRVLEDERLEALDHSIAARTRLESVPSIAPPLVASDRPQTFYIHAPDARAVSVRFGAAATRLRARALGRGIFRLEYDPRAHGTPDPPDGDVRATLEVDGSTHARSMRSVRPLPHPRGLAPSPDRRAVAAVSEETDELYVVDAAGLRHRIEVDDGPVDARFVLGGRRIVVSHRYAGSLLFLDAEDGSVILRRRVGFFGARLAVDESGTHVALAQGGARPRVLVIDASSGRVVARGEPGFEPDHVAFGPDGALVASSVRPPALHRLRREGATLDEDRPPLRLGRPPVAMAASAERLVVAVTDYQPEGPPHLANHFIQDQLVTVDVARWEVVDQRLTARRTDRQESPGNVDRGVSPMGLDLTPEGALLVAFAGTDDVWRVGATQPEPRIHGLDEHPLAAPHGVAALHGGGIAVSSPAYGTIGLLGPGGALVRLVRLAPGDRILIREDHAALQRRIGERTFYESTRAGISCQSCHLHGGSDGAIHNIGGYAPVSTLDTRGLLGTPPYLRDGGYPLLASFDELARTLFRGYRRPQGGRRVSLERYLESLPRPTPARQLEGRDGAREQRGLDVFVRARCVLCHVPPAFTNLGQHPIVALFPDQTAAASHEVDTPSLLGLGASAPYLVDGRAETLEEVFRVHDPGRRHGDTAGLSDDEIGDLIHFIEGL